MLVTFLLIYCLGISFYLLRTLRFQNKQTELDKIWKQITGKPDPSLEDIKAIAEVAKVRQTDIPWYERSLSTIGIVVFFSMLMATTFQTINSAKTEIESSNLRQELKVLESQSSIWKKLIKQLSEVITLKQVASNLEESERNVLTHRLIELDQIEKPSQEEDSEKLRLYVTLKQYDMASALIEKSKFLTADESAETLLFLAEMSFINGAKGQSKSLLEKFEPNLSKQPVAWQLRFFTLNAALAPEHQQSFTNSVAGIKRVSNSDADEWLKFKVDELKEGAKRRAASVSSQ